MKIMIAALLLALFSLQAHAQTNHERVQAVTDLRRLAFGSCNNQNDHQPLWNDLIRQKPDLWVWTGDAVYADWKSSNALAAAFREQNENPAFAKFRQQVPMLGVWDDHDYAFDNADGSLPEKKENQRVYLDFLEEPQESPRRKREGIYSSHDFNSRGSKVKIILLDNRYFKDLDPEAPMLGKAQWAWLEEELKNSKASLHFIVSGLSINSPLLPYSEEWGHYPGELDRLHGLFEKYGVKAPVFLSGDKHFSAMFMRWGHLEFLSSGMTHIVTRRAWWYLGMKYPATFFGLSYGQIDIEWQEGRPRLIMSMRSTSGADIHRSLFAWDGDRWIWE